MFLSRITKLSPKLTDGYSSRKGARRYEGRRINTDSADKQNGPQRVKPLITLAACT